MNSTLRASAFAAVTLTTPADEQTFYKPVGPTKAALLHAETGSHARAGPRDKTDHPSRL